MTKREIIKWLKQEKATALIKLSEEKDKAKRELYKKTYEEINMADFYKETELELNAILAEYKNKFDKKKLSTLTWSYSGFKMKLESLINYLNSYLEEDVKRMLGYYSNNGNINTNFNKLQDGVINNYDNLIYNIENMNKTKDIEEYLKSLGMKLPDTENANETTALVKPIDVRYLYLSINKNEDNNSENNVESN